MPGKTPIDLSKAELDAVNAVLCSRIPDRPVFVFGSRVTGLARPDSDLDLAIGGEQALSSTERMSLQDAFEEIGLHFKVDLIDLHDARGLFRKRIETEWIAWQTTEASHVEVAA